MTDTKRRYRIEYTDDCDLGCPVFTTHVRAYDREHAIERFMASPDADGWRIVKVTKVD